MVNEHGYFNGAVMLRGQIKEMRDHVEYEKFLCRMIKDDERTQQMKLNTEFLANTVNKNPKSLYKMQYNNEIVEKYTKAGKNKGK